MGGSTSVQSTQSAESAPKKLECQGDSCPIEAKPKVAEQKLKPCCACPETKKARDAWYLFCFILFYIESSIL